MFRVVLRIIQKTMDLDLHVWLYFVEQFRYRNSWVLIIAYSEYLSNYVSRFIPCNTKVDAQI